MTVLSSLYPGGHGELEPESLCGWMDWDSRDITETLHWDQVVKRDLPGKWGFPLFFFLISVFFDVLLSFDSVLPYFSINGTNEMFRICNFQPLVSLL